MTPDNRTTKGIEGDLRKAALEAMQRAGAIKTQAPGVPTAQQTRDLINRVLTPRIPKR